MGCPPVLGDNPHALATGLFCVQVDKHGITILYQQHQCRPCTSRAIYAKDGKGGIKTVTITYHRSTFVTQLKRHKQKHQPMLLF